MAYAKDCPECEGRSYGASKGEWVCPYCDEDLTDVEVVDHC